MNAIEEGATNSCISPKMLHEMQTHLLPNSRDGPDKHLVPMLINGVYRLRDTNKVSGIGNVSCQHISDAHRRIMRPHPNNGLGTCKYPATWRLSGPSQMPESNMHLNSAMIHHIPDLIHATTRDVNRCGNRPRHTTSEKKHSRRHQPMYVHKNGTCKFSTCMQLAITSHSRCGKFRCRIATNYHIPKE